MQVTNTYNLSVITTHMQASKFVRDTHTCKIEVEQRRHSYKLHIQNMGENNRF